mmetsp:Transcript_87073/g.244213  ORF Transcript_87073/g.244213 Transcript_87073/m.244213 type:complete len:353 (-) Transcript_87073:398-1456(-)
MVRTQLPVDAFQILMASALVDMTMESSCATANDRTPVRCPGKSRHKACSATMDPSPASSWAAIGFNTTVSKVLLLKPATTVFAFAHHEAETAFAPKRCEASSEISSAARGTSVFVPTASSTCSTSSPAFFFSFSCARFFRRRCRFFTSSSSWHRKISKTLPPPWHTSVSYSTPCGRANCKLKALPWPFGRGTAPKNSASGSASVPAADALRAKSRRNLSPDPHTSRVCEAFNAKDHTSTLCSTMVCKQSCSSTDQMRTKRSFDAVITRAGEPAVPSPDADANGAAPPSQKRTAVTWSTCPRKRATPISDTTSHSTTSVSLEPDANMCPARSKAKHDTADRWPCNVMITEPVS